MRDIKVKDVGGREATLINGKPHCIVLDNKQREIIKSRKGDSSMSEFVRDSIDLRFVIKGAEQEEEIRSLKEKLSKQTKQIKQYEQAKQKRQKVNEEQLAHIVKRYQEWEGTSGLINTQSRFNWAQGCVKGLPISPEDALTFLQGEGFFILK